MNWYEKSKIQIRSQNTRSNIFNYFKGIYYDIPHDVSELIEKRYPNAKRLGSGTNGVAFDIGNNKVLKVTKDTSEAIFAAKYLGHDFMHIAQVYAIDILYKKIVNSKNSSHIWGIILEKVDPLSEKDTILVNKIINEYLYSEDSEDSENSEDSEDSEKKYFIKKQLISLINELKSQSFGIDDIYADNLGWDSNGNLVVLDLGFLHDDRFRFR